MKGMLGSFNSGRRGNDLVELCRRATDKHLPGPYPEFNNEIVAIINSGKYRAQDVLVVFLNRLNQKRPQKVWLALELIRQVVHQCAPKVAPVLPQIMAEVNTIAARPMDRFSADLQAEQRMKQAAYALLNDQNPHRQAATRPPEQGFGHHVAPAQPRGGGSVYGAVDGLIHHATQLTEALQDAVLRATGPDGGDPNARAHLARLLEGVPRLQADMETALAELAGIADPGAEALMSRALAASDMLTNAVALQSEAWPLEATRGTARRGLAGQSQLVTLFWSGAQHKRDVLGGPGAAPPMPQPAAPAPAPQRFGQSQAAQAPPPAPVPAPAPPPALLDDIFGLGVPAPGPVPAGGGAPQGEPQQSPPPPPPPRSNNPFAPAGAGLGPSLSGAPAPSFTRPPQYGGVGNVSGGFDAHPTPSPQSGQVPGPPATNPAARPSLLPSGAQGSGALPSWVTQPPPRTIPPSADSQAPLSTSGQPSQDPPLAGDRPPVPPSPPSPFAAVQGGSRGPNPGAQQPGAQAPNGSLWGSQPGASATAGAPLSSAFGGHQEVSTSRPGSVGRTADAGRAEAPRLPKTPSGQSPQQPRQAAWDSFLAERVGSPTSSAVAAPAAAPAAKPAGAPQSAAATDMDDAFDSLMQLRLHNK